MLSSDIIFDICAAHRDIVRHRVLVEETTPRDWMVQPLWTWMNPEIADSGWRQTDRRKYNDLTKRSSVSTSFKVRKEIKLGYARHLIHL